MGGVGLTAVGERFRLICVIPGGQNGADGTGCLWWARGESSRSLVVRLQEELLYSNPSRPEGAGSSKVCVVTVELDT